MIRSDGNFYLNPIELETDGFPPLTPPDISPVADMAGQILVREEDNQGWRRFRLFQDINVTPYEDQRDYITYNGLDIFHGYSELGDERYYTSINQRGETWAVSAETFGDLQRYIDWSGGAHSRGTAFEDPYSRTLVERFWANNELEDPSDYYFIYRLYSEWTDTDKYEFFAKLNVFSKSAGILGFLQAWTVDEYFAGPVGSNLLGHVDQLKANRSNISSFEIAQALDTRSLGFEAFHLSGPAIRGGSVNW
ncbi:MAG: hypothetical protein BZY88_05615 [SAR202 cluster bacterium Io17-Chloro-G9]|nr:MAG: hypothetical protein BZY88_05615 [SAR202 cluster bacterium Io17-Chloro-G9]